MANEEEMGEVKCGIFQDGSLFPLTLYTTVGKKIRSIFEPDILERMQEKGRCLKQRRFFWRPQCRKSTRSTITDGLKGQIFLGSFCSFFFESVWKEPTL